MYKENTHEYNSKENSISERKGDSSDDRLECCHEFWSLGCKHPETVVEDESHTNKY
jgi:hypothetical protein